MTAQATGVQAQVANGALIVTVLDGDLPRVWRTDFARAATAVMEVRQKNGGYSLVLVSGGSEDTVADFTDKASASAALQSVTAAMTGSPAPAATSDAAPVRRSLLGRIVKWFFILVLVLAALLALRIGYLLLSGPQAAHPLPTGGAVIEKGVPLPLDKMLGGG